MKILSPRVHGYIDYAAVVLLFLAPTLFGFGGVAATLCYILGATQGVMTLLTAYPLGLAKIIPFPMHGGIELLAAVFALVSPWLFNFSHVDAARNFFIVASIGLGIVWLVTDYRAAQITTSTYGYRYGSERRSFS
jgi:hypothetical protein